MDKLKIIMALAALLLAAVGAFVLFGFLLAAVKVLLLLGVVLLVGAAVVKALRKPERKELTEARPERTLEDAERVLEEYRRKQLTK
jgi:membrane protein implicated in regulation of membrane protease activity